MICTDLYLPACTVNPSCLPVDSLLPLFRLAASACKYANHWTVPVCPVVCVFSPFPCCCAESPPDTSLSCYSHFHSIIPPTDLFRTQPPTSLLLRSVTVSSVCLGNRQDGTLLVVRSCMIAMKKTKQTAGANTGSEEFCILVWSTDMRHKFPLRTAWY